MRREFVFGSILVLLLTFAAAFAGFPLAWQTLLLTGPVIILGIFDMFQKGQTIRRNFPVLGRFRYLAEMIRPEIQQYFVESDEDGRPFSRNARSVVYARSKKQLATKPFGTMLDVYERGYEFVNHSLAPTHCNPDSLRITIGGPACKKPYRASVLNISAMSYGSLSKNAILALNGGARLGGFAHNTGEGGLTPHHLAPGGDVIWEIGTGYFSCRDDSGNFSPKMFQERAAHPHVKMIEIKLSQGAKPGHGGVLPAKKITPEISAIRGIPMGKDCLSPPGHSVFSSPRGLLQWVQQLRELSGGKPVGFKLCVGKRREFLAIVKAMHETGILPDYIVVDGGEGGTGAAPAEFSDHVGCPLNEALVLVHNALVGIDVRKHVRVLVAGRVITGFDVISRIAMGADACYSARGMMMALGCIQALRCNSNHCPTGVATNDPALVKGLDVTDKTVRVRNFHQQTVESVAELLGAMGLSHTMQLRPWHLMHRIGPFDIKHYGELFDYLEPGELLNNPPPSFKRAWDMATADAWDASEDLKAKGSFGYRATSVMRAEAGSP
ncbi:MAG: Glutamate synthase large chain precursor [Pseudomonadota bacterium]